MILDTFENAHRYKNLGERLGCALDFLAQPESRLLEPPATGSENSLRVAVRGDEIFALVQRYQAKSHAEAFWEAHRKYIDIQWVIEGVESMGHAHVDSLRTLREYDANKDYTMLSPPEGDQGNSMLRVSAGMFAIFMPHDA